MWWQNILPVRLEYEYTYKANSLEMWMENVSKKLSTSIVMSQTAKPKLWQQLFLFNKGDTGFSQKKKKKWGGQKSGWGRT